MDFKQNDLIIFLDKINLPILSNGQQQKCEAISSEKEIYDALKSIENDKTRVMMDYQKSFMKYFEMISEFH